MALTRLDLAQGITAYQTDYSMAALAIRAEGSPLQPADGSAFKLPMASLDGKPGRVPLQPLTHESLCLTQRRLLIPATQVLALE